MCTHTHTHTMGIDKNNEGIKDYFFKPHDIFKSEDNTYRLPFIIMKNVSKNEIS